MKGTVFLQVHRQRRSVVELELGNIRSGPLARTAGGRAGARLANQPTDQVGTQGSMLTQGRADPQAGPRPSTTTSQMSPAAVNARPNPP